MDASHDFDLAIAYRVYPLISKNPAYFSEDKFKLTELCLASFKRALGNLKLKVLVIADSCPAEYRALFGKYFSKEEMIYRDVSSIGNAGTFKLQLEWLLEQNFSDLAYFAEDDYYYLDDSFSDLVEFKKSCADADFVTPYDHLDYHTSPLHKYKIRSIESKGRVWRRVSSTCMTFLTDKESLNRKKKAFLSYTKRNSDFSLWTTITHIGAFRFHPYLKYFFTNFIFFKMFAKCWLFGWKENIFARPMNLFAPSPTVATHMEEETLSPGVDWRREFERGELLLKSDNKPYLTTLTFNASR